MSVKTRVATPYVLAVLTCLAAAAACSSTSNPGFTADDAGGASGSSASGSHSGSASGSGSGGGSGSSSSGSNSGSGASTSGSSASGSSSGSSSGTGSGSSASGSGSGTVDAGVACGAPTTGGIPLTGNGYASTGATGVPGNGGYTYAYSDSTPPPAMGTSTSCVDSTAFCGTVTTGAQTTTTWGGGIGVNLNQQGGGSIIGTFAATGTGIKYGLSALAAQGMRILIDNGGMDYCANLTTMAGTVPWSAFSLKCWAPDGGAGLSGPPATATHINFQVTAVAAAGAPFNFCVTSLGFAP